MVFTCSNYYKILGDYWIDPNEGDIRDAIMVYCDMDKKASCIYPKPDESPEISYSTQKKEFWLSDISEGFKVNINKKTLF